MTGGNLQVAYLFIASASLLIAAIISTLFVAKGIRAIRRQEWLRSEKKLEPYFDLVKQHLGREQKIPLPKQRMNHIEMMVIQDRLMEWTARVDGQARRDLSTLCEDFGFVDRDLRILSRKKGLRQAGAAYRLGMMRSQRAAEPLLKLLESQPFHSSLFIYARASALCARNTEDLERMVLALIQHRQPVQRLIATILEEAGGNTEELFTRLHKNRDPAVREIAEISMKPRPIELPRLTGSPANRRQLNQVKQPSSRAI